jgi:beta-glucanase (GH16 family)
MKKLLVVALGALLLAAATLMATPPAGYSLVWQDEFKGSTLDTNNWSYEVGRGDPVGWGNVEWEYYTDGHNLAIANDNCTITARKETENGPWSTGANANYTSTRMVSYNKAMFKYGYLEVALKGPKGDGLWPAFWTLGASIKDKTVGWPACGEMELYEARTGNWLTNGTIGDNYFIGTCHFMGAGGTSYNSKGKAYTEGLYLNYHKYAILWDSSSVQYYFDDQIYWPKSQTPNINQPSNFAAFHNPHYFIANIAIMGNYVSSAGINLGANTLPATMVIDYVKIYQDSKGTFIGNKTGIKQKIIPAPLCGGLVNPATAELKVFDMKGRMVGDYSNKVRSMGIGANPVAKLKSLLPVGTYIARMTDDGKQYSMRFAAAR